MHESKMHAHNSFVTLTYSDEHLPKGGTLRHEDFVKFLKRLRYYYPYEIRYYMCGEYGEQTWRPHYHACLFGHDWNDKTHYTTNSQGDPLYISGRLDKIWGMGLCTTGELNFRTAAYTARYIMQKRTGKGSDDHYRRYTAEGKSYQLKPEYNEMSRDGGIGLEFMKKYADDIYNEDKVIVNGKEQKPPKYYDKQLQKLHPWAWQEISETREWEAYQRREDNTPARLKVKEEVSKAAIRTLTRKL